MTNRFLLRLVVPLLHRNKGECTMNTATLTQAPARPMSRAAVWWLAARPHTLGLSAMPVLAGCALAWHQGAAPRLGVALLALLSAICIQIGTNLLNDVGDFERGADGPDRQGPLRATAQGLLTPHEVRCAGLGALAAAFVLGVPLVWLGGWPIVILGLLSLVCGWGYTSGPHPIAYGSLGEVFVWVFFGVAAVAGVCWLQGAPLNAATFWMGHILGTLAAAVMLVNNTRDMPTDAAAGRCTLAVRMGRRGCNVLYAVLLAQPYLAWPLLYKAQPIQAWTMLTLPWALWLVVRFARHPGGQALNVLLARTVRLQMGWVAVLLLGLLTEHFVLQPRLFIIR